jgi:prepilin-type N-terminal cleavage/methylation domain-containing protein
VLTLRKTDGFTLVELLIVILIIGMFITLASVNWTNRTKRGKEGLLEQFSINVSLLREDAVANYEDRIVEYDITMGTIRVGRIDQKDSFIETRELPLTDEYRLKDVVINGERCAVGKCYMTFHANGMVDRTIVHLEGKEQFYSLLVNPVTAEVTGENGYTEETTFKRRDNAS